jgi:hypothetical protein
MDGAGAETPARERFGIEAIEATLDGAKRRLR